MPWLLFPAATAHAGPPLLADTPFGIVTSNGDTVRTDNSSSASTAGSGNGSTPAEQYLAYDPSDPASTAAIQPGDTTILKSVETGMYCRLAPLPTNSSQTGMLCDQATAATARTTIQGWCTLGQCCSKVTKFPRR